MAYLAEGTDFRCGYKGAVNIDFLRDFSLKNQVVLEVVDPVIADGVRISSSEIRNSLLEGDFARCRRFLGRNFALGGSCLQWHWRKDSLVGTRRRGPCGCLQILPPAGSYPVVLHCRTREGFHGDSGEKLFSWAGKVLVQGESVELLLPADFAASLPVACDAAEALVVSSLEFTV